MTPGGRGRGRRGPGHGARHVNDAPRLHEHVRPAQHRHLGLWGKKMNETLTFVVCCRVIYSRILF